MWVFPIGAEFVRIREDLAVQRLEQKRIDSSLN
jgi:hypothetical protein